jgi:hypothetical protein
MIISFLASAKLTKVQYNSGRPTFPEKSHRKELIL